AVGRTVVFAENRATCINTEFDGRLVLHEVEHVRAPTVATYHVTYEYEAFTDRKRKEASTMYPRWARIGFDIACAECGVTSRHSTQNNLVRPYPVACACGEPFYEEMGELPIFECWKT